MLHSNKKSSTNNKKKKGNRNNSNNAGTSSNASSTTTQARAASTNSSFGGRDQHAPTLNDFPDWQHPPTPNKTECSTVYDRYKQATERFKNALAQMVPASIFVDTKVHCLLDAVDYLDAKSQGGETVDVDLQLMDDLKTSISFRKRVMKAVYQGGDEGHFYFVEVLIYCWVTLKEIVYKTNVSSRQAESSNINDNMHQTANRFGALSVEDVLDDSDAIFEGTETETPKRRPPPPIKMLSLYDLTHGDDSFRARMFLLSMDEMMQFISVFYSTMKKSWRRHTAQGIPSNTFVENIMEASVYVNFCIQQITLMEEEFNAAYPYLNTVYRMMMFLVHPGWVKEFSDKVVLLSPLRDSFIESHDALAFIGDIVETGFRNPSDVYSKTEPITTAFCTKWHIHDSSIDSHVQQFTKIGRMESPLHQEKAMNRQYMDIMGSFGLKSHSWFAPFKFIGGRDRCLLHTVRLMQGLSNVVKKGKPLVLKRGFFGRQWDEGRKQASKICDDMDELLMGDLLPTLLSMCTDGMLSTKLPRELELLTFFSALKTFTNSPEKAIPWSLAFAVHALLTSFFEMQGHNDIEKLGAMAKSSFHLYVQQISNLIDQQNHTSEGKHWHTNLKQIQSLRWLVRPTSNQGPTVEERAIWNPLCSGLFMEYICFFANLDGGMTMIDSFAQLRMVLHLFNAFKQIGALQTGKIELLDWLYDVFKDSKAVWEGPIPRKGEFVKRWWISYGASIPNAQQMSIATKARLLGSDGNTPAAPSRPPLQSDYRDMTPINPEDIALCFRRVCLHDFSGIEDKYPTEMQRQRSKGSVVYELAVRSNATMDTMDKEQRLLASNFIVIGHILNEFVERLFNVLEWTTHINQIIAETPDSIKAGRRVNGSSVHRNSWEASDTNLRRFAMVTLMAERLLGPLDVVPTLGELVNFNPDRSLPRSAASLLSCFQRIKPDDVYFFKPYILEDKLV